MSFSLAAILLRCSRNQSSALLRKMRFAILLCNYCPNLPTKEFVLSFDPSSLGRIEHNELNVYAPLEYAKHETPSTQIGLSLVK
jgi:hypothetical protein